jgi:hypothetical protein
MLRVMSLARLLATVVIGSWVAGCAQAVPAGSSGDDEPGSPDAPSGDTPDASVSDTDAGVVADAAPGAPDAAPPAPDARPGPITLSQTTTDQITRGTGCWDGWGTNEATHYYRAFKLADFGVTGELAVSEIQFGVFRAVSSGWNVEQPLTVRLHTLTGDVVSTDGLTEIASATVQVRDGDRQVVEAPITATVPAGGTLVVELAVAATNHYFSLGANSGGERVPAYVRAPSCDVRNLSELARQTYPPAHALISVTGTPR